MSVIVIGKFAGDTDKFKEFFASGDPRIMEISGAGKAQGAIHHRFGIGDGFILVIDEWPTAEAFQAFFGGHPDLPGLVADAGALGPPEFTFVEAANTPDEF